MKRNEVMQKDLNVISEFRKAPQDCNLVDEGYRGYSFTWANGKYGSQFIEERLDRFLCNGK